MHKRLCTAVAVAVVTLTGCDPIADWFQPSHEASPPMLGPAIDYPPVEASVINLPIAFSLAPIQAEINRMVPNPLAEKPSWNPGDYQYKVTREAIELSLRGGSLHWNIPITIWGAGRTHILVWHERSCTAKTHLRLMTRFFLGQDWRLQSKTTPQRRSYSPRCVVTIADLGVHKFTHDFTGTVDDAVEPHHAKVAQHIDVEAPKLVDPKALAQLIWDGLSQPIEVQDGVWLDVNPDFLLYKGLSGSGARATLEVGLVAHPRLVFGTKPAGEDKPLPPPRSESGGRGFHVALEMALPYETASDELRQRLAGKTYTLAERDVEVTDVRVYGGGEQLVLELSTRGDFKGRVFVTGTPRYDAEHKRLLVDGLDYDVHSRDLLVETADWLLHETWRAQLTQAARWDLAEDLRRVEEALNATLNRPLAKGVSLQGKATLQPRAILATDTAFKILMVADGQAWLSLDKLTLGQH